MNSEDMVACLIWILFDIRRIWTSSIGSLTKVGTLIIKVLTHCQRPCADFRSVVGSPVDVDITILLKSPVRPLSELSITHIFVPSLLSGDN